MKFVLHMLLFISFALLVFIAHNASGQTADSSARASSRRPIIYVMPNAVSSPGANDGSQVVVDSSHNGKEPQTAKIYQELQHRKECEGFMENMIKDKADYFLLLQHGGGKGNRWAASNKNGDVIASGDSLKLGNSVKDACLAMSKDWQEQGSSK
jgi:predicted Mrr-cat superfamily restriction endonuclease